MIITGFIENINVIFSCEFILQMQRHKGPLL